MKDILVSFVLGVILVVIGILNMRGNISTLHRYHRHRVSQEDIPVFGRLVGLGTIICGGACLAQGVFFGLALVTSVTTLTLVGTVLLSAGIVAGMGINLYAIIKYNKGLF